MNKIAAGKNETVAGCFVPEENRVYNAKEQPEEAFDHTLGHELYHVMKEQMAGLTTEEDKADAFGTFLMKLLSHTGIRVKDLLK